MNSTQTARVTAGVRNAWIRRTSILAAGLSAWGGIFFAAAGRIDWPPAWLAMALSLASMAVNAVVTFARNPALAAERWKRRTDSKPFDRVCSPLMVLFAYSVPLSAGLELRFAGPSFGEEALWAGMALVVLGIVPISWTLGSNPHAETTVRIQTDRGHKVTSTGPYRFVRHPMYAGLILQQAGLPLLLGLAWAYVPAALFSAVLIVRTALEDRTLRGELPGYRDYAAKTRYRLLPGVW